MPLVVSGAAAGAAAAVLSYLALAVIALAAWMLDPGGDQEWSQMLEAASGAWLAGLGLAPTLDGVTVSLLPLGFALVPLVALVGAARWAADASSVARRSEALAVAVSAGVAFAAVAAVIATLARSLFVPAGHAAAVGGLVAGVTCAFVVMSRARVLGWRDLPQQARDAIGAIAVALAGLVLVGSLLAAIAVIAHVDQMTSVLAELNPGPSGSVLLAAMSLAYLPNAVMWAIAYAVGPGITVSVGSVLSPYADPVSATLPGFPLLAALPSQTPPGAALLPLLGLATGAVAGAFLRRRDRVGLRGAGIAVLTGAGAGFAVALLAWLTSGSLGTTSLQGLGPAPLATGLACAALVSLGALLVAVWPPRRSDG